MKTQTNHLFEIPKEIQTSASSEEESKKKKFSTDNASLPSEIGNYSHIYKYLKLKMKIFY